MSTLTKPSCSPVPPHDPNDRRLGQFIEPLSSLEELGRRDIVLVGFPIDEGVRRNAGRPGAAAAPDEIRTALYKLSIEDAEAGVDFAHLHLADAGNVDPSLSLESAQSALAGVVRAIASSGAVPIILGGGHETSWGHFQGVGGGGRLKIINIDAHLDYRISADGRSTSGNSFRLAVESAPRGTVAYTCIGAQPHANSSRYTRDMLAAGGKIHWHREVAERGMEPLLAQAIGSTSPVMATLDIDVVSSAFAPGCSAANPHGMGTGEFLAAARLFGASPLVRSLDIVEFAPCLDRDGQTARLAALAIWNFLRGFIERRKT